MKLTFAGRTLRIIMDAKNDLRLAEEGKIADSDTEQGTIFIKRNLPKDVFEEVLTHELLHHLWAVTPLPTLAGELEETVIRSLSPWMMAAGFKPPKLEK
jgi:hypothetical protein